MKTHALLSGALLLLLVSVVPTTRSETPITVLVTNTVTNTPNKTYSTNVTFRGILIGGLRRLNDSKTANFTFTYTEDPNYGPFLQSVNGLAGNSEEGTYWELLVKTTNGSITRPDVGIGCYIPRANDQIILNFNMFQASAADTGHQNGIIGIIWDYYQIYLFPFSFFFF